MKYIIATLAFILIISGQALAQISTINLEAHYTFNGSTNDSSGMGNNGINHGATYASDRFGNVLSSGQFSGAEYVEVLNDFDFEERTVSLWFYADTITSTDGVIYNSDNGDLAYGSTILKVSNNSGQKSIRFSVSSTAAGYIHFEPIIEKEWYHVSITVTNDSIHYYLNCNAVASYPFTASSSSDGTATTKIGGGRLYNNYFLGKIDDIRVYSTEVDSSIQMQLCNNESQIVNAITHLSNNENTINIYPNPANDIVTIDYRNITINSGYSLKIHNSSGQEIFTSQITKQKFKKPARLIGPTGIYLVLITDLNNGIIVAKKLILN